MRWPSGLNGFPAPPSSEPRLKGRNCVAVARELGRHRDQFRVDGEVHECPPCECHVLRVAVAAVLGDRVVDVLAGERVLQLGGRDRDPVQEERQVDRLRLVGRVGELADEHEPVCLVPRDQLRREGVGRLEVREPDLDAEILDPVAEHLDRAALVELGGEPLEEVRPRSLVAAVARGELAPLLRLRRLDEREHLARIEPERPVEGARIALRVAAVLEEVRLDRALELPLGRAYHEPHCPHSGAFRERGVRPAGW